MSDKSLALILTVCLVGATACSKSANPAAPSAVAAAPAKPTIAVTKVVSQELSRTLRLPGELQPYQDVQLYPKVQGFITWIGVDRGSEVKAGQLLVRLSAPELEAQRGEAEAKTRVPAAQKLEAESHISGIRAQRLEAEAKLAASTATYRRLQQAAATPGAVSGNELENAQRLMEADAARVEYYKDAEQSAQAQAHAYGEVEKVTRAAVRSAQVNEAYLRINAPFDGVITERNAHPGALAGPASGTSPAVLRLQQISRLRLVVAVPEAEIAGVTRGANVNFTVPAFPGEAFTGTVARIGHALDPKTRTMSVELDVNNAGRKLAPGMFPQVNWPTRRPRPSLLVPASAVATTTEKSFVIRVRNDVAEWVDVKRGTSINQQGADWVEVFGDLAEGDTVAVRGTDELRAGTQVNAKPAAGK